MEFVGCKDQHYSLTSGVLMWGPKSLWWYAAAGFNGLVKADCANILPNPQSAGHIGPWQEYLNHGNQQTLQIRLPAPPTLEPMSKFTSTPLSAFPLFLYLMGNKIYASGSRLLLLCSDPTRPPWRELPSHRCFCIVSTVAPPSLLCMVTRGLSLRPQDTKPSHWLPTTMFSSHQVSAW